METAPLHALCTRISSGGTPSRKHPEYFADEGGHLWVKSQELVDRPISDTSEKISDLGLKKSSAKYYDEGTVLVAMYGATVGQMAILQAPATVNQAICALCVDPEVADFRYVFYSLMATRHDLTVQAAGAAQQNLNQGLIRNFEIPVFPLEVQSTIADILGNMDDLIENNRRRIAILEELARLIYREWFQHFRFPGSEGTQFVDSDIGPIPTDWTVDYLSNDLPFRLSKPPVRPYEGAKTYLPTAAVDGTHRIVSGEQIAFEDLPSRAQHAPLSSSVWMARMANYQKILLFPPEIQTPEYALSSGFLCLECVPVWWDYIACRVISPDFEEVKARFATGATQVSLTDAGAKSIPWLLPPDELVEAFSTRVRPLFRLLLTLHEQNRVLAAARDLLLPRLISGELDVKDLEPSLDSVA